MALQPLFIRDWKQLSAYGKFKQTKVKTKIINGSPAPVYKWLEAIECLQSIYTQVASVLLVLSVFEISKQEYIINNYE